MARTAAGVKMDTTLAPTHPAAAELERPAPTARRLAEASISPNTRRAYSGALRRLDAWLDGRPLEDATLAAYLGELHDQGRASASAATAVAAACFRARLADELTPAGERTARVLAGYRRTAGSRGRGQARPFGAADLAAVLATCHRPRRRGRGVESDQVIQEAVGWGMEIPSQVPTIPSRRWKTDEKQAATRRRGPDAWSTPSSSGSRRTASSSPAATASRSGSSEAGDTWLERLRGWACGRRRALELGRGGAGRGVVSILPPRGGLHQPEHPPGAAVRGGGTWPPSLATCHQPRRRGRESEEVALERGRLDAVIAGLLFMGGMRRSEVSALALGRRRRRGRRRRGTSGSWAASPEPSGRSGPPRTRRRRTASCRQAAAKSAGLERVTAHSGRTSRGASTTDVMLAGNWKTSRMVAHYSAGATAARGAVARLS